MRSCSISLIDFISYINMSRAALRQAHFGVLMILKKAAFRIMNVVVFSVFNRGFVII